MVPAAERRRGPLFGPEGGFLLPSALSGPSRLAFRVPPGVTEIPFNLGGLLDWTSLTPSLAPNAVGRKEPPPSPAPAPAEPAPMATAIEAPYRLILSPVPTGRWAKARNPVTRSGVTELWHARLVARKFPFGPEADDRILRPVWTPDRLESAQVLTALSADQRRTIVSLGGDLSRNRPDPISTRVVALSARGAWLDVDASWTIPDPPIPAFDSFEVRQVVEQALREAQLSPPSDDVLLQIIDDVVTGFIPPGLPSDVELALRRALLETAGFARDAGELVDRLLAALPERAVVSWRHRMLQGRDDAVATITPGFLLPWGHPVDLIQDTRREFVASAPGKFTAALVTRATIRVRDSDRSFFESLDRYPHGGRETPFLLARLTGDLTRPIRPLDDTNAPTWLLTPDGAADLMWTVMCLDRALRPVTMTMALLFVPLRVDQPAPGGRETLLSDEPSPLEIYRNDPRSVVDLGGQQMTFVENVLDGSPASVEADERNAASLVAHAVSLAGVPANAGAGAASFLPSLASADVSIPSVDALLGTAGTTTRVPLRYDDTYLRAGFDATRNAAQVFARLGEHTIPGLDIVSLPERAGGLLRPRMAVQGLSKVLGPVPDVDEVLRGRLEPSSFIPDIKILGGYSLKMLIAPVLAGLTPGDLGALADLEPEDLWERLTETTVGIPMPALTTRRLLDAAGATSAVETRFVWKPDLNRAVPLPDGLKLSDAARLVVQTTIRTPFDGTPPSFESRGELANFAISFAGVATVSLAALQFTARDGRKLELSATGVTLRFHGDLAFVERIRQFIPPEGFSDPPSIAVTPNGITAGYSLGLPSIGVGVFSFENVALSASLELPFIEAPTRLRFTLSERHDPFLVTVSMFGGGGFLAITLDTQGNVGVEGAVEFGGNFCLDLVVASGGVHVLAGIYFKLAGKIVELSGYLRVGGAVTVLGIITVTVEFYLALTYHHDDGPPPMSVVSGDATLTVGVEVLFLRQDVTLRVHREFANPVGDPTFEDLMSLDAWTSYCNAFAA